MVDAWHPDIKQVMNAGPTAASCARAAGICLRITYACAQVLFGCIVVWVLMSRDSIPTPFWVSVLVVMAAANTGWRILEEETLRRAKREAARGYATNFDPFSDLAYVDDETGRVVRLQGEPRLSPEVLHARLAKIDERVARHGDTQVPRADRLPVQLIRVAGVAAVGAGCLLIVAGAKHEYLLPSVVFVALGAFSTSALLTLRNWASFKRVSFVAVAAFGAGLWLSLLVMATNHDTRISALAASGMILFAAIAGTSTRSVPGFLDHAGTALMGFVAPATAEWLGFAPGLGTEALVVLTVTLFGTAVLTRGPGNFADMLVLVPLSGWLVSDGFGLDQSEVDVGAIWIAVAVLMVTRVVYGFIPLSARRKVVLVLCLVYTYMLVASFLWL